jgi:acetyl esterase/lipase
MREPSGVAAEPASIWRADQTVAEAIVCNLFGGSQAEVPEAYRMFSPATYVGPHCPPTLLLQGEHDALVSAERVRDLAQRLTMAGVPAVYIEYPQTEHAFDLLLSPVSPVAQAALYEVDRFLAIVSGPKP